jgi:NADH dehydrogenase/NADH:ubiquinone oxidoreductase subunit G
LPGFNENLNTTNWISDKTRFSFDVMFSPERFLKSFIIKEKKIINSTWNQIFKEILYFLYFQDHLNNHQITINYFILIFNSNIV